MLCQDCPNRSSCLKLCKKAKDYVGQNHVVLRELPIGLPMYGENLWLISNIPMTKMEKKIVSLIGQGLIRKEVCEILQISRLALRAHLIRLRKKCNESD